MNDEGVVLAGHLVGLNCIDANLCMKGDDLDNQVFSLISGTLTIAGKFVNLCRL